MAGTRYKISGHEKFPFRDGWLTKGICLLKDEDIDASIFNDNYAADKLGVGSNMVKSIRYWMTSCGLLKKEGSKLVLSNLAEVIYEHDKYFEDEFTWWLIHSNLVKNKQNATIWNIFFNITDLDIFEKDEVENVINKELSLLINGAYSEKSVKDSLDVLLNMYSKMISRADDPEEKNICPLSSLGLISRDGNSFTLSRPDIRKIKNELVLYELSDMFEKEDSLSIDRIYSGVNGLGNIYHMTRTQVNQFLDSLEDSGYIKVNRTAGLDVVYAINVPEKEKIICDYYK